MWAIGFIISLVIGLVVGRFMIPILHNLKFGQSIREEGPKSHQKKQGTPTMGGILFMITVVVTLLVTGQFYSITWFVVGSAFLFGGIGLLDDAIKIVMHHNEGLTPWQKIGLQLLAAVIIIFWASRLDMNISDFWVPLFNIVLPLGILYWPIMVFIILGTTNSANLTDGLDGLLTTVSIIIFLAFFAVVKLYNEPHSLVVIAVMLGACLAFLYYNRNPARVFMGDTGSFFIGGMVVALSMVTKTELLLPLICFTYMIESCSDIIQVLVYKKTKRRVFRMAPLHHHFELGGRTENQVVLLFSIITLVTSALGVLLFWTALL
ncbi:MAG: phospho-N-acetylmuramoyl-pentapeptide-transferase [Peptococcaceae bacterium]|nr:phospho-N-acetylmuramoyl-pentapeptide-transferase [Peptococcaceae bacterium]